jgi:hypothetical protein
MDTKTKDSFIQALRVFTESLNLMAAAIEHAIDTCNKTPDTVEAKSIEIFNEICKEESEISQAIPEVQKVIKVKMSETLATAKKIRTCINCQEPMPETAGYKFCSVPCRDLFHKKEQKWQRWQDAGKIDKSVQIRDIPISEGVGRPKKQPAPIKKVPIPVKMVKVEQIPVNADPMDNILREIEERQKQPYQFS